jgi:hypothetical protein
MRTTVDLPDDLHAITTSIACDSRTSFSETVARLLRSALGGPGPATLGTSERTGLTTITLGRVVTSDDVHALGNDA